MSSSRSLTFAGFFPLYRSLIHHTMENRLSNNEALVLIWLTLLADRRTGSYTINGRTLRTYLPGLTKSGAQDALEGLQRKMYIYRDVKPRSPIAYRYWVNGFRPTDGPHKEKNLQLDLSEVFATKDTSKLRWVPVTPEDPLDSLLDHQPESKPDAPNYNEKREERSEKREKIQLPTTTTTECDESEDNDVPLTVETVCSAKCDNVIRACDFDVTPSVTESVPDVCLAISPDSTAPAIKPPLTRDNNPANLRFAGDDLGYIGRRNERFTSDEINASVESLGMGFADGEFRSLADGSPVPLTEAHELINNRNFDFVTGEMA